MVRSCGKPYGCRLSCGEGVAGFPELLDEYEFECPIEIAEEVGKMIELSIKKAGELLKLNVPLKGEAKIGLNWKETH